MTSIPSAPEMSTPAAPAPAAKKPWGRWIALGCVGLVVLAALFAALMFFVVKKATAGPEEVVRQFLAAAAAGDYAKAHGFFSAPLKEAQPLADFIASAEANPTLFAVTDTTFNERSVDLGGARLSGTVTLTAGTKVPAQFDLAKENDTWKLIGYHIGQGD
jgi:hypothetical protein